MDTINYSVRRMQSEPSTEEFPMASVEMPALPVPMAPESVPMAPPVPEVPEAPKPVEATVPLAPKKQYYGFSRPTGFPGTEGAEEAGMSTTQKIGLTALGAIVLGSLFRT